MVTAVAQHRSAQDILAERRAVVQKQRRETEAAAGAILQHQIDELERELAALTSSMPLTSEERSARLIDHWEHSIILPNEVQQ